MNIGWKYVPEISADYSKLFKEETGVPVIVNGGFQEMNFIEQTLQSGKADMIPMARPLLANINLIDLFRQEIKPN